MTTARAFTRAAVGLTATCAMAAFAAAAAAADTTASCAAPVYSQTQLRVLDRAAQGPGALRRYVAIVQPIHQVGYVEAVAWIDGERDRLAGCRTAAMRPPAASR